MSRSRDAWSPCNEPSSKSRHASRATIWFAIAAALIRETSAGGQTSLAKDDAMPTLSAQTSNPLWPRSKTTDGFWNLPADQPDPTKLELNACTIHFVSQRSRDLVTVPSNNVRDC